MLFLSNRKLKLLIIALLLTIFAFFLGLLSPKAQVINTYVGASATNSQSDLITRNFNLFNNAGEGQVIYQVLISGKYTAHSIVASTHNGGAAPCQFGVSNSYNDNTTQQQLFSLVCNVDLTNDYLEGITVWGYNNGGISITWGGNIQFTDINSNGISAQDYSTILNNILTDSNAILQNTYLINYDTAQINNKLSQLLTQATNNSNNISDIKDSINDSNIDNNTASSSASSWNSKNTTNGTITNLLTLPITLLQAIVNGIQTSCTSFTLGTLFNTTLTLPCINLSNLIGSELFGVIDLLISGFIILAIGKKLVKIFNDFTNLRSNQVDELYGGGQ